MGLTYYDARRLWEARLEGRSFEHTLTFGRQQLFLHPKELKDLRGLFQVHSKGRDPLENYRFGDYADVFWRDFIGVKQLTTLDYSDYEGATLVQDMNTPAPADLHCRFDAVIEAGSLEHVFQFPTAIGNLMKMTKVGGSLFLTTLANNLCGHGFYQFSPELHYRIFSPENGFSPPKIVLLEGSFPGVELVPIRAAYEVTDPAQVHGRVGLQTATPVLMMVDAKKIRDVEPFQTNPQQSDYVSTWEGGTATSLPPKKDGVMRGALRQIRAAMPLPLQRRIDGYRSKRSYSFHNPVFYRRLP